MSKDKNKISTDANYNIQDLAMYVQDMFKDGYTEEEVVSWGLTVSSFMGWTEKDIRWMIEAFKFHIRALKEKRNQKRYYIKAKPDIEEDGYHDAVNEHRRTEWDILVRNQK